MISNNHYIEVWVQGQVVELKDQGSLNLRINNVLFDPTKTSTKQAEYSFSFEIPSTPTNDRIFNYANNLAVLNKFHNRYSSQVYADGKLIFDGSLTIQKYSAKDKMYTCNLVNIKVNTLEDIFGDMVMTDLKWEIPFDGAPTINEVNANENTKFFFPMVCYGAFQKNYVTKDEVGATYTPKHTLDKYNKWWVESFYPSLNVMETVKRAFAAKGYNVNGSALSEPEISLIYASTNLAQDQIPIYNLGNPKFGEVNLNISFSNQYNNSSSSSSSSSEGSTHGHHSGSFVGNKTFMTATGGLDQELSFPYEVVRPAMNASNYSTSQVEYNFDTITLWNMMDSANNSGVTVNVLSPTYMYDPNEMVIVIPSDGWYKIDLQCSATLNDAGSSFSANQWTTTYREGDEFNKDRTVAMTKNFKDRTPLEIQLIRNYDDNVELIKGNYNVTWDTGDCNQTEYTISGGSYTSSTYQNKTEWMTDAPHQDPFGSRAPTKMDNILSQSTASRNEALAIYGNGSEYGNNSSTNSSSSSSSSGGGSFGGGGRRAPSRTASFGGMRGGGTKYNTYGFMHQDGQVMPYDQAVSPAFICGMSTMSNGTLSVMRNGSSWSPLCSINNNVFAKVKGLDLVNPTTAGTEIIETNYCKNDYKDSTNVLAVTNNSMNGSLQCCVYLKKDDILELMAIQRDYEGQKYSISANCSLKITAMSERRQDQLKADPYWGFNSPTELPQNLNLFKFTNRETKISDWISDIQKAFNLIIEQDGNDVWINTQKGIKKDINYAIDIDDRVNSNEVESQYISYPREMAVKYKIDTDEWGFELTVPPEHINDEGDEWKKWGDSGFTVINLSDDSYETSSQTVQTNFSYTYYDHFLYKLVNQDGSESEYSGLTISMPVISKAEYMAEGYGYDEAMKHDGYSMTQRFWYRDQPSQEYVWLSDHMREKVYLSYPMNVWKGFNLSYKDTEKSIVTEYFNIAPLLASNFVNVDVYITPKEYNDIRGGAAIHFDSDLYITSEINGYDPSGNNPTSLKMIKKV